MAPGIPPPDVVRVESNRARAFAVGFMGLRLLTGESGRPVTWLALFARPGEPDFYEQNIAKLFFAAFTPGLMLAAELALAGVDVAVLERRPGQQLRQWRGRWRGAGRRGGCGLRREVGVRRLADPEPGQAAVRQRIDRFGARGASSAWRPCRR